MDTVNKKTLLSSMYGYIAEEETAIVQETAKKFSGDLRERSQKALGFRAAIKFIEEYGGN